MASAVFDRYTWRITGYIAKKLRTWAIPYTRVMRSCWFIGLWPCQEVEDEVGPVEQADLWSSGHKSDTYHSTIGVEDGSAT